MAASLIDRLITRSRGFYLLWVSNSIPPGGHSSSLIRAQDTAPGLGIQS